MQDFQNHCPALVTMSFQIFSSLGVVLGEFQLGIGIPGFGLIAFGSAIAFTYWQIRAFMAVRNLWNRKQLHFGNLFGSS